jgi:ketosteroid isomerase-like protein
VNRSMKSARAMVPLLVCLLLVQATGAACRKPQAQATDPKQGVIKFEKEWWEAFKTRDRAALERILADEFLGFDNDAGEPRTKGQWIAAYAMDKNFRVDSYSIERIDVLVVGDTAVAAVHYSAHFTVNGKASSERAIDLDTLVRRNGRWQAVATGEVHVTTPK